MTSRSLPDRCGVGAVCSFSHVGRRSRSNRYRATIAQFVEGLSPHVIEVVQFSGQPMHHLVEQGSLECRVGNWGGSPEDVSDAVLFILGADYFTGDTIIVDGGRHIRK